MAHIAIIGAGMAGISLARRLTTAGHNCLVFEKSSELGGRLATQKFGLWQVDHGTQYFTVRSERFAAEVATWQQQGWVSPWLITPWLVSRDTMQPSPDDQQRWVGTPAMNSMIEGMAQGLEVYCDTRIDRLEAHAEQWRLWDEKGEHYGLFDAVLLTAPLAQSLALLPEGSIAEPTLRRANMTPTWTCALAISEPTGIAADAVFSQDGIVTWAAKDSSKPLRPDTFESWVIHFDDKWTANHLNASEQLLQQQALRFLERLAEKPLANVQACYQYRWLYARSRISDAPIVQWDNRKRIGLAGDWTLGSRLEDAWLSADHLAKQLLVAFGSPE